MPEAILTGLKKINRGVAMLIGILLLTCVVFVLTEIVVRKLGSSLGGTDEISGYVMAIATSWGMAFTLLELGHVRIDFLRVKAKPRGRVMFDLFSMLVLTGTVTLIAFRSWPVVARSLENGSRANTPLETPLALVQIPWFLGWAWFAVVAWLTLFVAVLLVLRKDFSKAEEAIGTFGEEGAVQ